MALDARKRNNIFGSRRNGQFADYSRFPTYYVGLGGNSNTTTRIRRYIGDVESRPLLPEHDLSTPQDLIVPDQTQLNPLVAFGPLVQFYHDKRKLFELNNPQPYPNGWFDFHTVCEPHHDLPVSCISFTERKITGLGERAPKQTQKSAGKIKRRTSQSM